MWFGRIFEENLFVVFWFLQLHFYTFSKLIQCQVTWHNVYICCKDNLFANPLLNINASLRITGKIFCKIIVIVEKLLNVNFYIHFISCTTKYLSGNNIYFFHFTIPMEALDKSLIISWAKMKKIDNAKCCWGFGTTGTLRYCW